LREAIPKDVEPFAKDVGIDKSTLYKIERGTSVGDPKSLEAIAKELKVTVEWLTGEKPGESEDLAMQRISAHIQQYFIDHPHVTQEAFAKAAGIGPRQVRQIISDRLKTVPHKPTLEGIAKAIYGPNATIDDILKPPTRTS